MSFIKKIMAVRGAVRCDNNDKDIQKHVCTLFLSILDKNKITEKNIISIQFTVTADLTELNPASALRKNNLASNLPLFCALEPSIKNSLPKTVRILIHYYGKKKSIPVYLNGAEVLRPDIF